MSADQSSDYYLTFRVGKQWCAVDVLKVFEVVNMVAISPLPDMPEALLGIVNLRGSIVPILDLRIRFNMPEREIDLITPIIFLRHRASMYGIVVDDVDDVIHLPPEAISTIDLKQRADHITGLTDHEGRLIMILDPVRLLSSSLKGQTLDDLTEQIQQSGS